MSNSKRRRAQAKKSHQGRNESFMRATLDHANMNLTVPSGKRYKREKAGARNRWSED